jgi:UDP-3-O-[3-hydroxymyristoyl] glucosamine N-acyltransferase
MTNTAFFKPALVPTQSLADLFQDLPCPVSVLGDAAQAQVSHIAPLDMASVGAFSFLSNVHLREQLLSSQASVVVVSKTDFAWLKEQQGQETIQKSSLYVLADQPYVVYAHVAQRLYLQRHIKAGIHPTTVIDDTAVLATSCQIDARVVVGARAQIGERVRLMAGAVIGDEVVIGDDSTVYPNVTIYHGCQIGLRAIIHAGAVIGADGFGFAPTKSGWQKIPQVGRVVVGDDVEIGANTCIDRGALSDTVIHDGVKLDNQIQIAHNCVIGEHTAVASCVGIAGSAVIGARCMIGGAAMIGGHLTIADGTVVSAATAVPSSLTEAGQYSGVFPPMLHREWERNASLIRHLSDLRKRIRALEKSSGQ